MSELYPRTDDYCVVCGESPESATHIFDHSYVYPNSQSHEISAVLAELATEIDEILKSE